MGIDLDRVYAALRPGQAKAVQTIIERVRVSEGYTSVILPTRYGKTDVARLSVAYCVDAHLACVGLFLTVTEFLRGQAADEEKWTECFVRCGVSVPVPIRQLKFLGVRYTANGERCLVATIQLVQQNLDHFCAWIDSISRATGLPVLVFIDECHTGSQTNAWGQVARALRAHGALIVLLTATAIRSDGELIDGFRCVELSSEPASWVSTRPNVDPTRITVDFWEGEKKRVRLLADWETTFQDAWRESPSPLCKLSRVPFDVDLMTVQAGLTEKERVGWLSEKSGDEARSLLGRLVRDIRVIRDGVHRLVRELHLFQRLDRTAGGIVFCGNDTETGGFGIDDHVRGVSRELARQAPGLTCVIATMKQGDQAADIVRAFCKGNVGDVLIVKQMASLGMDAPRLKVCLDLSPVRQDASCLQRWFRVATPYERFQVGVLIHPDDVLGKAIFQGWVKEQGGAQEHRHGEVVRTIDVPRRPTPPPLVTLVSGTGPADFEDTQRNRAEAELQQPAYLLAERFPVLLTEYSHAQIADQTRGITFDPDAIAAAQAVSDLTSTIEGEQDDIVLIIEEIMRVRYPSTRPYDKRDWGDTKQALWRDLYREAGVTFPKGGLRHITDRRELARLKVVAEFMRSREVGNGSGSSAP